MLRCDFLLRYFCDLEALSKPQRCSCQRHADLSALFLACSRRIVAFGRRKHAMQCLQLHLLAASARASPGNSRLPAEVSFTDSIPNTELALPLIH